MERPVTFTFRMPQAVRVGAAAAASRERISLNTWLLRLIDGELARQARAAKRTATTP